LFAGLAGSPPSARNKNAGTKNAGNKKPWNKKGRRYAGLRKRKNRAIN
jgi:hypothetical protein